MFERSQKVLVVKGAFEGLFGALVVPPNSDGGTCRVRVRLWGQEVTVELPLGWLAPVAEEGLTDDGADEPFVRFGQAST